MWWCMLKYKMLTCTNWLTPLVVCENTFVPRLARILYVQCLIFLVVVTLPIHSLLCHLFTACVHGEGYRVSDENRSALVQRWWCYFRRQDVVRRCVHNRVVTLCHSTRVEILVKNELLGLISTDKQPLMFTCE